MSMWILIKRYRAGSKQLITDHDSRIDTRAWKRWLYFALQPLQVFIFALILTSQSFAMPLKLEVGNVSYASDRNDSTLLKQAHQIFLREQEKLHKTFGLTMNDSLRIYFYYSQDKMPSRIHSVPYWSGGVAQAGSEIHIFGHNRMNWLITLKHELFHILVHQNEVDIPVWLNEGLAQWYAGQSDWGKFVELGTATARGKLIPLVDLDIVLSFNHKRASLGYGQALDASKFLIKHQGVSILPYLLKPGDLSFRERFFKETGESIIDFEIAWREDLESRLWYFKVSQIPGVLWALSPLIVILAWFLKYRRGRRKLAEWETEEREKLLN